MDNTPQDITAMLRWGSLREDGFTGGAVAAGFELFDPETTADHRRATLVRKSREAMGVGATGEGEGEGEGASKSDSGKDKHDGKRWQEMLSGKKVVDGGGAV